MADKEKDVVKDYFANNPNRSIANEVMIMEYAKENAFENYGKSLQDLQDRVQRGRTIMYKRIGKYVEVVFDTGKQDTAARSRRR